MRGEILVTYREGGTDVDIALARRGQGRIHQSQVASAEYWSTIWFDWFKSHRDGTSFVIEDRVGGETDRLDDANTLGRDEED